MPIAPMRRLADSVHKPDGEVRVELSFGHDQSGRPCVRGTIEGTLELVCQRCLAGLPYRCDINVNLALVASEQGTEELQPGYEPLVVADTPLSLSELVEDELILALPFVPAHESSQCAVKERYRARVDLKGNSTSNPFRILGEVRDG